MNAPRFRSTLRSPAPRQTPSDPRLATTTRSRILSQLSGCRDAARTNHPVQLSFCFEKEPADSRDLFHARVVTRRSCPNDLLRPARPCWSRRLRSVPCRHHREPSATGSPVLDEPYDAHQRQWIGQAERESPERRPIGPTEVSVIDASKVAESRRLRAGKPDADDTAGIGTVRRIVERYQVPVGAMYGQAEVTPPTVRNWRRESMGWTQTATQTTPVRLAAIAANAKAGGIERQLLMPTSAPTLQKESMP